MDDIIIKTEHFSFRIINANDYELYYKLMLDEPEIQWVFQVDDIKEKSKKNLLDAMMSFYWEPLIEGKERETYTIFLKDTVEFVGEISLYHNKYSRMEIGVSILKKYRGQGIGKEIIKEWSMWLADDRALQEVDIHIDEENIASRKCIEGLGANYMCNDGSRYYQLKLPVQ